MTDTKDIKDFTKYPSLSDNDYLLGVKSDLNGSDAAITVSNLKKQVAEDIKPEVKNGYWWVNGLNTGERASGRTPEFRQTEDGFEMKYEDEDEAAFRLVVPFLKFEDLTEEQKALLKPTLADFTEDEIARLKLTFVDLTDTDKAELMKPAVDAAAEAKEQGDYAKTQGDYAKAQAGKIPVHETLSESAYAKLVEEGKIDDNVYYCTYEDEA